MLWNAEIRAQFIVLLAAIGLLAAVGVAMGFFINVNKFSLHAMYRSRLIRAFLGASRAERQPHWFTGFDPADNIPAHQLKPGRPFHVINMALNLVQGGQLAWQERMAASFTVSLAALWQLAGRLSGGGVLRQRNFARHGTRSFRGGGES